MSDAVVVPSDVSSVTCRCMPLNPQGSPLSPDRGFMESPVTDVVFVADSDMLPVTGLCTPPNPPGSQVSLLSSVQLSPNRVQSDYPMFAASQRSDGDLPHLSPISSPESTSSRTSLTAGSRLV